MRTFARISPVSVAWSISDPDERTNVPRDEVSRVRRLPATELPPTTCDELVTTLVRAGGRVLARQEHGVFLAIRRHLVFVPSVSRVSGIELADVLSAARLTPERFLDLRAAASP